MSHFLKFKGALRRKKWEVARDLLMCCPDLACRLDDKGRALVSYAAQDGRWEEVCWLLAAGALNEQALHGWLKSHEHAPPDVEVKFEAMCALEGQPALGCGGESLLEVAIQGFRRHMAIALALKKWDGDESDWKRAWFVAVKRFDAGICNAMESKVGERPSMPAWIDLATHAIRCGKFDALQWLGERGLDVTGKDATGSTLLGQAAQSGPRGLEALEWSIKRGAPIDELDGAGHCALYYAVAHGCELAAMTLINAGANPDVRQGKRGQGASPLRLASKKGAREMRQILVGPMERVVLMHCVTPTEKSATRSGRL